MTIEKPTMRQLEELLGENDLNIWNRLINTIDGLYNMDRFWNKGFGDWVYEYKYRKSSKTLCTFYVKPNIANILITLGKKECENFEMKRDSFSESIQNLFNNTKLFHDGKWLWIPINDKLLFDDVIKILKIKRKPNR